MVLQHGLNQVQRTIRILDMRIHKWLNGRKHNSMRVRIMFMFAGELNDWWIDWFLPFFPSKGETFDIIEFVECGIIKDFKDKTFEGCVRYHGIKKSMYDMLFDGYNVEIENIHWCPRHIEIELKPTDYNRDYWKEVNE